MERSEFARLTTGVGLECDLAFQILVVTCVITTSSADVHDAKVFSGFGNAKFGCAFTVQMGCVEYLTRGGSIPTVSQKKRNSEPSKRRHDGDADTKNRFATERKGALTKFRRCIVSLSALHAQQHVFSSTLMHVLSSTAVFVQSGPCAQCLHDSLSVSHRG